MSYAAVFILGIAVGWMVCERALWWYISKEMDYLVNCDGGDERLNLDN